MRHAWLLLVLSFTLLAATSGEPCGDARLSGNRYYGAMRASLKTNAVDLRAVERALQSAEPFDPLEFVTPEKHQIIAKRLFADLVKDPRVREEWSETKAMLKRLLDAEQGLENVRIEAERATKALLAPHVIYSFDAGWDVENLRFARLPDGREVVARASGNPRKQLVITTLSGDDILTLPLPKPAPNQVLWKFGWHRNREGQLSLYLAAGEFYGGGKTKCYLYRLRWGSTEIENILASACESMPTFLRSVGPDHILLVTSNHDTFNLAGKRAEWVKGTITSNPQSAAVTRSGELVTRTLVDGAEAVFTTREGDTYHFSARAGFLTYNLIGSSPWHTIAQSKDKTHDLRVFETSNGRLLLVQTLSADASSNTRTLRVYAPLESNALILSQDFETEKPPTDLQWINGPRGVLVGAVSGDAVHFGDLSKKSLMTVHFSPGETFGGWFPSENRGYYWLKDGTQVRIYDLSFEVPR